ncbi:AAA family ATPase [Acinetobacter sp. A47]|uniref:AAA family ATPase n=1 Tax=Acinetobacter sp. A47 TaxID=1561217 RepID=UPI0005715B69|nr:AAA family ATPase [Acinetobacter sp. A47]
MTDVNVNDNLILVCGESATGKSACLRNLSSKTLYLNCESGKKLPFRDKFRKSIVITDPYQVYQGFEWAQGREDVDNIVIDGFNYLMDMFESQYIVGAEDSRAGWQQYAEFVRNLMQLHVANSDKNVIFTAHTRTTYNEQTLSMETKVPIKGALANTGIESFFSFIVSTKKEKLKTLENFKNDLLEISPRDQAVGYKHVFQTLITADTVQERMRGPMGMFDDNETFIDNDVNLLIKRCHEYYGTDEAAA